MGLLCVCVLAMLFALVGYDEFIWLTGWAGAKLE